MASRRKTTLSVCLFAISVILTHALHDLRYPEHTAPSSVYFGHSLVIDSMDIDTEVQAAATVELFLHFVAARHCVGDGGVADYGVR